MRGAGPLMPVSIQNRQRRVRLSLPRLRALAGRTLSALGRADQEVHVGVVGDREIRRLNARYLGHRRPTDVLAFNLDAPGPARLLGEVIISAETARRQSRRLRVPLALELDLLLVHGLLHLVGYDDHDPVEARLMHERERELLSRGCRRLPDRLWDGLLRP
ncbi:MAG TPA: rRNA maturation RNase YbeY [Methylomirabilota bacterium]|nr:rRNA maturation RNase YbeY [Methylomirabilota bacterium]